MLWLHTKYVHFVCLAELPKPSYHIVVCPLASAVIALIIVLLQLTNNYNAIQSGLKQYIDFTQLVGIVTQSRHAQHSFAFAKIAVFGLFTADMSVITNALSTCVYPAKGLSKYLIESYAIPVGLLLALVVVLAVLSAVQWRRGEQFDGSQFYHTLWQIILLCYSKLVSAGLNLSICKRVAGTSILMFDDSVRCDGQYYWMASSVSIMVAGIVSTSSTGVAFRWAWMAPPSQM